MLKLDVVLCPAVTVQYTAYIVTINLVFIGPVVIPCISW